MSMEQTYHVITRHTKYVDIESRPNLQNQHKLGRRPMPNYKQKVSHKSMRPNRLDLAWSRGRHVLQNSMLTIPERSI